MLTWLKDLLFCDGNWDACCLHYFSTAGRRSFLDRRMGRSKMVLHLRRRNVHLSILFVFGRNHRRNDGP